MISKTKQQFWQYYSSLPEEIKELAKQAYKQFQQEPFYPGLQFKKIQNSAVVSVRIGIHYRALGIMTASDTVTWNWIGHHSEYDKLISYGK